MNKQFKKDYLRIFKKPVLIADYDRIMTQKITSKTPHKPGEFNHSIPIQLRFKDGDVMGHVNNANHFTYMEIARIRYFHDVVDKKNDWQKNGIILAKITIDYLEPIIISDDITVSTRCSRLGNKSFEMEYEIRCVVKGKRIVKARGNSTLVCFDYLKNTTVVIPEKWRKKIIAFDHL